MVYEYWVVPAPRKGEKARGLKTGEERFAMALTNVMNSMAAQGWEYQRADALPCDERSGLTGTKTTFHNVLVFRRALGVGEDRESAGAPSAFTAIAPPVAPAAPVLGAAVQPLGAAPALGPATTDD
ncbi:MAG: hypothetical protein RIR04_988 [Pseudomonadota bacterium]